MGLLLLLILIVLAVAAVYRYQQRHREKTYHRPEPSEPLKPLPKLQPKEMTLERSEQIVQDFENTVLPHLPPRDQLEYQCLRLKAQRLKINFADFFAGRIPIRVSSADWYLVILGMVEELRQRESAD